ncbi:MAG: triose-phosphate isomerase, partial [Bdellovibrionales bacterium]|nr:triose-phosphate isomerase [Bdellovibrionales bacterium]
MAGCFYLVANWKMHFTPSEATEVYSQFVNLMSSGEYSKEQVQMWVASPAVSLLALQSRKSPSVRYGSQNVHYEDSGAFTGEISAPMVLSCGGEFSLVGHSERRHLFGEGDDLLQKRTTGALRHGLDVIFCIGEQLSDREKGQTNEVLAQQITPVLSLMDEYQSKLLLAYEPVWAIGTGKVATTTEIQSAHHFIKDFCKTKTSNSVVPVVLYGGSVKPDNIREI